MKGRYQHTFKLWRENPELIDSGLVGASYVLADAAEKRNQSLGIGAIEAVVALAEFLSKTDFWESWEPKQRDPKVWASYRRGHSRAERARRGDVDSNSLRYTAR
jgi:hypothetical protein